MGSRSDIAQYKIETPPMPSMTPSDAYQPDDGLMTEDDTRRDETLRHLVKGVAPSKKNARELNLLAVGDDDDDTTPQPPASAPQPSQYGDDDFGCFGDDDDDTTPQPTASASPGFGWANKSHCRDKGCGDNQCSTRDATNENTVYTNFSNGKNDNNKQTSKSGQRPNIIIDIIAKDSILQELEKQIIGVVNKHGHKYVPLDSRARSMNDIRMGWGMNFPPEREEFIAQSGLLCLRDDLLPKSKCQRSNFNTMMIVLQDVGTFTYRHSRLYVWYFIYLCFLIKAINQL